MSQRTRKPITIHKVLHPRNYIDRLCIKKGGRELTSIENSVDVTIQGLKEYTEKCGKKKTDCISQ